MKKDYIETGKIVTTHGVRGTLRVQPWCDTPDFLCKFKVLYIKSGAEFKPLTVLSAHAHKNVVLVNIDGVTSIEKADTLKNKILYIARKDLNLEDGNFLIDDIIGCVAIDSKTGKQLGIITDVSKTGANDVWHIEDNNKEYLIPVIESVVKEVNIEKERVIISPIPGIFD